MIGALAKSHGVTVDEVFTECDRRFGVLPLGPFSLSPVDFATLIRWIESHHREPIVDPPSLNSYFTPLAVEFKREIEFDDDRFSAACSRIIRRVGIHDDESDGKVLFDLFVWHFRERPKQKIRPSSATNRRSRKQT